MTLQQYPLINSVGLDELEAGIAALFGSCAIDAAQRFRSANFRSTINHTSLQHIGLMYGSYNAAFSAKLGSTDHFVQGFPLSGYGQHKIGHVVTTATPGILTNAIIAPDDSSELQYSTPFAHIVLSIKPASLRRKLDALTGSPIARPLDFVKRASYDCREAFALRQLVSLMVEQLSDASALTSPLVVAELEQTIMVAFLCSNESNFSSLLKGKPASSAPWQVRRAEDYIAAHWDQPITIDALAVATNVSARSLFHSFRKVRGCSPMALVKQIRLQKARQMLMAPQADTSVTSVAYMCGFGNLGHFANDYLATFGERPSETLRLSRH